MSSFSRKKILIAVFAVALLSWCWKTEQKTIKVADWERQVTNELYNYYVDHQGLWDETQKALAFSQRAQADKTTQHADTLTITAYNKQFETSEQFASQLTSNLHRQLWYTQIQQKTKKTDCRGLYVTTHVFRYADSPLEPVWFYHARGFLQDETQSYVIAMQTDTKKKAEKYAKNMRSIDCPTAG